MTPSGIDPATFQFVAQSLNHRATTCPYIYLSYNTFNTYQANHSQLLQYITPMASYFNI
jgi:hypothetical protein